MNALAASGLAPAAVTAAPAPRPPENVAAAAKQFEALMIAQLLKEARGGEGGWLGSGEDTGSATVSSRCTRAPGGLS